MKHKYLKFRCETCKHVVSASSPAGLTSGMRYHRKKCSGRKFSNVDMEGQKPSRRTKNNKRILETEHFASKKQDWLHTYNERGVMDRRLRRVRTTGATFVYVPQYGGPEDESRIIKLLMLLELGYAEWLRLHRCPACNGTKINTSGGTCRICLGSGERMVPRDELPKVRVRE